MSIGKVNAEIKLDIDNIEDLEAAIEDLITDRIAVKVNLVLKLSEE